MPSEALWRIVSSKRITPLMCSSTPSVVKSSSRYARRFSSVDSTPIESKRFLIVPSLSSAARIPLPGATRALAISSRVWSRSWSPCRSSFGHSRRRRLSRLLSYPGPSADVAQLVEHQLPKLRVAGSIPVVRFPLIEPKPALLGGFRCLGAVTRLPLETAQDRCTLGRTGARVGHHGRRRSSSKRRRSIATPSLLRKPRETRRGEPLSHASGVSSRAGSYENRDPVDVVEHHG